MCAVLQWTTCDAYCPVYRLGSFLQPILLILSVTRGPTETSSPLYFFRSVCGFLHKRMLRQRKSIKTLKCAFVRSLHAAVRYTGTLLATALAVLALYGEARQSELFQQSATAPVLQSNRKRQPQTHLGFGVCTSWHNSKRQLVEAERSKYAS
jgi:hypothetical protein